MTHVEKLLNSFRSIDWKASPNKASDHDLLCARLYLDGVADLIKKNDQTSASSMGPFFSPNRTFCSEIELLSQDVISECEALTEKSSNAYEAMYCKYALEWAALRDRSHSVTAGHEDLFTPLMGLITKRVSAIPRKGYWVVDENMFPLFDWPAKYGVNVS
jgi:hypothetical protein